MWNKYYEKKRNTMHKLFFFGFNLLLTGTYTKTHQHTVYNNRNQQQNKIDRYTHVVSESHSFFSSLLTYQWFQPRKIKTNSNYTCSEEWREKNVLYVYKRHRGEKILVCIGKKKSKKDKYLTQQQWRRSIKEQLPNLSYFVSTHYFILLHSIRIVVILWDYLNLLFPSSSSRQYQSKIGKCVVILEMEKKKGKKGKRKI